MRSSFSVPVTLPSTLEGYCSAFDCSEGDRREISDREADRCGTRYKMGLSPKREALLRSPARLLDAPHRLENVSQGREQKQFAQACPSQKWPRPASLVEL